MQFSEPRPIEYLAQQRFQDETRVRRLLRRYAPEGTQKLIERIRALEDFEAELSALDANEIERLVVEQRRKSWEQHREACLKEDRHHLFNSAFAELTRENVEFWSKAAVWSLEEAIALTFGKAPQVVSAETMLSSRQYLPSVRRYLELNELIKRGVAAGELTDPIKPINFLDWMGRKNIRVSEAVEREVRSLHSSSRPDEKSDLLPRERASVHKLIIGMAIACYKHDPKAARSKTASAIVTDLLEIGLPINEDTVHSWLKQAAMVLPTDFKLERT